MSSEVVLEAGALERRLGRVLHVGSIASMVCFAAGLAALFLGADRRWADGLMHAGLVILFATPFARVLVTAAAYWRAREWTFVAMTSIVLLVLIGSVFVAFV